MRSYEFKKARRRAGKLRLALTGPAGSGKTYSAMLIAKGLGGRIALIDTEGASAALYEDVADFDVLTLEPPYSPEDFCAAIQAAEAGGYETLIIDSLSHEWDGMIALAEDARKRNRQGNSMLAWAEVMPRHKKLMAAILNSGLNIIATMRVKTAYIEVELPNGKTKMAKQGTKIEQRDGTDYEFTTVFELSREGNLAWAGKDRTRLFGDEAFRITEDTGRELGQWLAGGEMPSAIKQELFFEMARRHGRNKEAMLGELTNYFGRLVSSSGELTDSEVEDFLGALRAERQWAESGGADVFSDEEPAEYRQAELV